MAINFGVVEVATEDLLKAVERRVRIATGLGDRAFLTLWPDDFLAMNPRAAQFCAIRPTNFPVWQSVVSGSGFGSGVTGFNAGLTLGVFTQNGSDPEDWSTNALSEFVLGVTSLVLKVVAAVQEFVPTTPDGDAMVREYMRLADSGFRFTPVTGKGGPWVKASLDVEMKYGAKLPDVPDIT